MPGYWFQRRRRAAAEAEFPFRGQGMGVPTLREVLQRYPRAAHHRAEGQRAGARARARSTRSAPPAPSTAWRSAPSYWRVLRAARASTSRGSATGAAREETRWALYRSWVGWPLGAPPYREFQVPEARPGSRRSSRRGSSSTRTRGAAGEGLDRQRPRRHAPAARLGRRRAHHRSARPRRRRRSRRT